LRIGFIRRVRVGSVFIAEFKRVIIFARYRRGGRGRIGAQALIFIAAKSGERIDNAIDIVIIFICVTV